jgi:hypothetical protein
VPQFKKEDDGSFSVEANDYVINEKDSTEGLHRIRFYRPRHRRVFARIERWLEKKNGNY